MKVGLPTVLVPAVITSARHSSRRSTPASACSSQPTAASEQGRTRLATYRCTSARSRPESPVAAFGGDPDTKDRCRRGEQGVRSIDAIPGDLDHIDLPGIVGLTAARHSESAFGLSDVATDLASGLYRIGLCGFSADLTAGR